MPSLHADQSNRLIDENARTRTGEKMWKPELHHACFQSVLTHGKMLPKAGALRGFVASRLRLPRTVKNFLSLVSMLFFKANGSRSACWVLNLALMCSGTSGLLSSR